MKNSIVNFICCLLATINKIESVVETISFGSCFDPNKGSSIWNIVGSYSPNQLILLGDQIYTDKVKNFRKRKNQSPSIIAEQYELFKEAKQWKQLEQSIDGWIATFDDHDYGIDNADKTYTFRNESQKLFWEFAHPQKPKFNPNTQTGVFSSKKISKLIDNNQNSPYTYKIIMMDTRSNKDPVGTKDGDFLGELQWEWLANELMDPAVDLIILGSSIQVLSDDKVVEETWGEFPKARKRLLDLICITAMTNNIVILSGDIHRGELSRAKCHMQVENYNKLFDETNDREENLGLTLDLVDLTSSGLSHTFTATTKVPLSDTGDEEITVVSRGRFAQFIDNLYMAFYPAHYREHKFADAYTSIHFGLLEILSITPEENLFSTMTTESVDININKGNTTSFYIIKG